MEDSAKEAIIFIPGFSTASRSQVLNDFLILGLTTRIETYQVMLEPEDIKIKGQTGKRLICQSFEDERKIIDIYESFWGDLINPLSSKSVKEQVIQGLLVLVYWLSSGMWHMARKSRLLFAQFLIVMSLNALWYYGNLLVILIAIGQNPNAFGLHVPPDLAAQLAIIGKSMGGWSVWIITTFILSLSPVPISNLVDITDFMARYLQDETQAGFGGARDRIRQRIASVLNDVLEQDYAKVTILAHSLGVMLGIDFIAGYRSKLGQSIRYISMGGPVELMSYKSAWVIEETEKCLNNPLLTSWTDYYSDQDWLCTKTPIPQNSQSHKLHHIKIKLRVSLAQQLVGASHNAYFFEQPLLEDLLVG